MKLKVELKTDPIDATQYADSGPMTRGAAPKQCGKVSGRVVSNETDMREPTQRSLT